MLPDYTTSACLPRVSEKADLRTLTSTTAAIASGDARLCIVTALRVGNGVSTVLVRSAQTGPHVHTAMGANGNQKAASLTQLAGRRCGTVP